MVDEITSGTCGENMIHRTSMLLIILALLFVSACDETVYKNPVLNYESKFAYIPILEVNGKVKVVNTSTSTLVTEIFVGANPTGVAINEDGSRAYVVLRPVDKQAEIVVIDTHTNTLLAEHIPSVGINASGIVYHPDQHALFVTHNNGVTRVDIGTFDSYTVHDTPIPAKFNSLGIEYLGDYLVTTGSTYDSNNQITDSGVSLIDLATDTVVDDLSLGNSGSGGVAVDETNSRIFVANRFTDNISIISVSSTGLVEEDYIDLRIGSNPLGISFDAANSRLYVSNSAQSSFQSAGDSSNGGLAVIELNKGNSITYNKLSYEGSPYAYDGAMHILMSQYDPDQERLFLVKDLWLPTPEGGVYLSAMNVNLIQVDINSEKSTKVNENTKPQFVGRFIGPICSECPQGELSTVGTNNQQASLNWAFLLILCFGLGFIRRRLN